MQVQTKQYVYLVEAYIIAYLYLNGLHGSGHLHTLQINNCDSNLWLVVDEDDNGKFRLERVKANTFKFKTFLRQSHVKFRH